MHEETIIQSEGFIEPVVSAFGIDETMLLPSDSHDNLVVLDVAKVFSTQENNLQFQEFFVASDCHEICDIHQLFQEGQNDHDIINGAEIIKEQLGFLNQLKIDHVLQDPIVVWMDSFLQRILNVAAFDMQ
jgi:hypothetical protein